MTVSYNLDVSQTSLIGFLRLQLRWRGSIWKSILKEVLFFCVVFLFVSFIYHSPAILDNEQRMYWNDISALFDSKMDYIPLTFMLGFFVTIIVNRWNEIFNNVGWIDPRNFSLLMIASIPTISNEFSLLFFSIALIMTTYLRGSDEKSRILRRNVIRYMSLTQVLVYRDISMQVRRRFPTLETIVAANLMTEEERTLLADSPLKYSKYFMPIQWAFTILYEARVSGKISVDLQLNEIMKAILDFRRGLAQLTNFDWVPIPLVYPQVVFLAVRSYFLLAIISRQAVLIDGEKPENEHFSYPLVAFIMTTLQFIFYVGWMKVAESLMNPLGEDDDDFECNFLIDRNLQLGLAIVDDCYNVVPQQTKDAFWSDKLVEPLYSTESANKFICPQVGSAAQYETAADEVVMIPHESTEQDVEVDGDEERLLPRVVSVVSVNKDTGGSRMSLNSRKGKNGILGTIKNRFSREGSRLSRPGRLGLTRSSQSSLNTPLDYAGSSIDMLEELAAEAAKAVTAEGGGRNNLTADNVDTSSTPRRDRSPAPEALHSVPEEDEETQRTRTSIDMRMWLNEVNKHQKQPDPNGRS